MKQLKNLIDTQLQPTFNVINNAILVSKSLLINVDERLIKLLDMHETSVKVYFDKIGENSSELDVATNNFFEMKV